MIDVESLQREASWRGITSKATEGLNHMVHNSGVRGVEIDLIITIVPPRPKPQTTVRPGTAPEILAYVLALIVSASIVVFALFTDRTGWAIAMTAPIFAALLGLGFIAYTSRRTQGRDPRIHGF